MSRFVTPACLRRVTRCLLSVAPLCWSVACADGATHDSAVAPSCAGLAAAGSGGPTEPAAQVRCSLAYAACLAQSPLGILRCTEEAESCGLFIAAAAGAPATGAGGVLASPGTTSPTCALRIAECVVRDPFRAQECQQMACDLPPH